jgi:hypothetical protein
MTIQARMSAEDRRLYNPSRDVAHNFKDVMDLVAARLEDKAWPDLDALLEREKVTMDDLGAACGAYCNYLASAVNEPNLPMQQSLEKHGFFNCKPAAQIAVLALIGSCYAGIQFAGVREATINGEGPLQSVGDLLKHAENFRKYAGMSKLRRAWEKFKRKFQSVFQVLRGG